MKTYQVFRNDSKIKDNCTINEAYSVLPAGSVLISGNKSEEFIHPDGKIETITEIRAYYKVPTGGHITIIENKTT